MSLNCNYSGLIPLMHMSKNYSDERNRWYLDHQWFFLKKTVPAGGNESIFFWYDIKTFTDFLASYAITPKSYLRIYFASINGMLDLIYAVQDNNNPNAELYFRFTGGSFMSVPKGAPNQPGTASYWVNEYLTKKAPEIQKNVPTDTIPTRALKHKFENLHEFMNEILMQGPTGIKAYISSYTDHEPPGIPANMMFVNFVFTSKDASATEQDVFIDDCPNYIIRKKLTVAYWKKRKSLGLVDKTGSQRLMFDFDNATLCPPDTNCQALLTLP